MALAIVWFGLANAVLHVPVSLSRPVAPADTGGTAADSLIWPNEDFVNPQEEASGISIPLPDNIQYNVEYNPETGMYEVVQTVGDTISYRNGTTMTLEEYLDSDMMENIYEYWNEIKEEEAAAEKDFAPNIKIESKGFEKIFRGDQIEIRPQGSAEISFGVNITHTDNPRIPERQRTNAIFDFDQKIQLNVVGKIGEAMNLNVNYNTESTFDFENQMKLAYEGDEDQIIQKIELGNVQLPLQGTLIQGSQSLFGAKVETKWGRLRNTTVFSQQKGERKEINVQGGAQTQNFEISADNYEVNRHYFLSGWFRDQYDAAMASLPVVNSGVNITRIEVWVVNIQANTQDVRNVIAFTDLGEYGNAADGAVNYMSTNLPIPQLTDDPNLAITLLRNPSNLNNEIYSECINNPEIMNFTGANAAIAALPYGFDQGIHYERVGNARKLSPSEYTYNSRLGFVSLKQALNNAEVLGVSYEYTLNGQTFQVGTLSQDGFTAPQSLILKMLKSSITQVKLDNGDPSILWDNMMKNVYSLGSFGINPENFRLDIWWNNPATGTDMNYIPREPLDGKRLLELMNIDRVDINSMPYPDGVFDFVPNAATMGGTIDAQTGRVYLPMVEPFGSHLANLIRDGIPDPAQAESIISQIVFQPLYDSTKTAAQQIPQLNRYRIKGQFQSASSSEISLNALNIPQGSVTVTAGGILLQEGVDYQVDYNLGRVRILNEGVLTSGQPVKVSLESNSMFNMQFKTMIGSRFDYAFNDYLNVGGTVLNLRERPITQKVNVGDEPVNNTILGLDANFQKEAPFLTRLVDALPLIETSKKSTIDFGGEVAALFPGHSRAISRDGNAYVDDFEGSQSLIDIRMLSQWFLASTPKGQPSLFPEGALEDSLAYGYNRARLAWYVIDPTVFFNPSGLTPDNVTADMRSHHCMREVLENEVFPNRELPPGTPLNIATLDLGYYPSERGQYNYDLPGGSPFSSGLQPDGALAEPDTRWAGIQRALTTTDFEAANIEFIQFWLMDPFNADSENSSGGELYFNLGNISEDVLNDSQLAYENGYPIDDAGLQPIESTWGFFPDPSNFNVVNAFDNTTGSYTAQDIGIDGMTDPEESVFHQSWLSSLQAALDPDAYAAYAADPSADNYLYFRGSEQDNANNGDGADILERYKKFNGYEGNSNTATPEGFPIAATTIPNTEDINQDITLNTIESYFQYQVSLRPGDLGESNIGTNFITDSFEKEVTTANGETRTIRWYQFKIPVRSPDKVVNGIADLRSIRYIRMFLKGWNEPVCLRFARLELVRGEWRKYLESLEGPQETEPDDEPETIFNIAAVNIEENGNRDPVNYVVPPGIIREQDVASANLRNLNEQALSMEVCNLKDGDARAAYRNTNFDMRLYKRLRMFAHAEALGIESALQDKDITCFVRVGTDYDQNYYEYELPLEVTPWYSGDDDEIWPEANNFDIELKLLQELKILHRPADWNTQVEFSRQEGNARLSIRGNPNLAEVMTVMVGIRNPDKDDNPWNPADDGTSECAIVWVNELRLSEFDETGGWAAVARLNATLADFGTFAVAGNISKPGWGNLEQKVQERQQSTKMGFDANSTLQMGKFFPENWGVQLPMYLGYSESVDQPRFSPLQPDVEMADIPSLSRPLKKKSQDFTKRRSINFSQIRIDPKGGGGEGGKGQEGAGKGEKEKTPGGKEESEAAGKPGGGGGDKGGKGGGDKSYPWDVSNFTLNYSYNEEYRSNIDFDWRLNKRYKGGLAYTYNNKAKEIKPFSKIGFIKNTKALKWVKEFNFYAPWAFKSIGFTTEMDRMYETQRIRNNTLELFGVYSDMLITTQVLKSWNWTRGYNFKYDITKSLKFDYTANNMGLVMEPQGLIDRNDVQWYEAYRDTVWGNIRDWGTTTNFSQNASLNYKLPFDKFPIIDFLSGDARYAATYRWDRAPFTQDTLGNTIQNSRNIQFNTQANFETLYNKVPLLKQINTGKGKKDDKKKEGKVDPTTKDGFGKDEDEKKKKEAVNPLHLTLRFLMMLRNASGSYTRNEGILLPGYARSTRMIGMDENFDAPGWGFVFGQQNTDIWGNEAATNYALSAAENGYLVIQPNLNQQYTETFSETWNYKINLEPIKNLKIELSANRQEARNANSFFRFDDDLQAYSFDSPMETGNITVSVVTWPTAFVKDEPDNGWTSETFETFLLYRLDASARMNAATYTLDEPLPNGFFQGWGPTSQDVVIPAFIAAYTGKSMNEVSLDPFGTKVQPNWKATYDGLTKIPSIKKYFKQFNLNHQYRSTLTTSYVRNLNYTENEEGLPSALDQSENPNWIPERQISTVTISEQITPLGLDMTIKTGKNNDPQLKLEFKRDRTVALGLANYQITETKSNSVILGVGYKLTEVPNPFGRKKGSRLPIKLLDKTTITIRTDVTMRDNVTLVRRMVERTNQPTAGQRLWSIKASADMAMSDKLTLRFFYDHQITRPKVSISFPTWNINTGVSLRFSLNG